MQQDQLNSENLMKMEDDLKQQGDWEAANRIAKNSVCTGCVSDEESVLRDAVVRVS